MTVIYSNCNCMYWPGLNPGHKLVVERDSEQSGPVRGIMNLGVKKFSPGAQHFSD